MPAEALILTAHIHVHTAQRESESKSQVSCSLCVTSSQCVARDGHMQMALGRCTCARPHSIPLDVGLIMTHYRDDRCHDVEPLCDQE